MRYDLPGRGNKLGNDWPTVDLCSFNQVAGRTDLEQISTAQSLLKGLSEFGRVAPAALLCYS